MKSLEELELQFRNERVPNVPGYNGKLEFRELKHKDAPLLAPILRTDRSNLSTFLGKYHGHKNWSIKSATGFVSNLLKQPWPTMTWLFLINGEPVGLVSTAPEENIKECQLIISVFSKHQGKGLATSMTRKVLEITEEVFGFERTWWHVDAANQPSLRVAQKCGFQFVGSYDTNSRDRNSTGLYCRLSKERPSDLAPGILQGAPMEYWWVAKDPGILQVMVDNQKLREESQGSIRQMEMEAEGTLFDLDHLEDEG
jgi:RimJ/RimL family protein N-acetyltransferase